MNFNLSIKDNTVEYISVQEKLCVDKEYPLQLVLSNSFESFPDEKPIQILNSSSSNSHSSYHSSSANHLVVYASSFKQGNHAEEKFIRNCQKMGWISIPTSASDDKVRRIDVVMKIGEKYLLVDVKAAKRLNRSDKDVQYRYHWFELHRTGSLFSGESLMLALEIDDGKFALFAKTEIQQWIKPRLENQVPVLNSKQALLRPYQREGRLKEWITLVDVQDIMYLCKGII